MPKEQPRDLTFSAPLPDGRVYLNTSKLKNHRRQLGLSQIGLAEYSASIRQSISIASIKRAELGKPVIYRTALQLAKLFNEEVSALTIDSVAEKLPSSAFPLRTVAGTLPLQMVGREGEFRYIQYLLQLTLDQLSGTFIYLRGVAGIGKSRLLEEVITSAQSQHFRVVHTRFYGSLSRQGMDTLAPLIRGWLGIDESADMDLTARAIQLRLQARDLYDDTHLYVSHVLGLDLLPQDLEIYKALSHETRTNKTRQAISRLAQLSAQDGPWMVVIDDVHWASEDMLSLLGQIIFDCRQVHVAWIMASRHENDPLESKIRAHLADQSVHIVEIPPLSAKDAKTLAMQTLPGMSGSQLESVAQAKGNPLFLTQLLFNHENSILPSSLLDIVDFKISLLNDKDLKAVQMTAAVQQEIELVALRELMDDFDYSPTTPVRLRIFRAINENTFSYAHDLVMRGVYDRIQPDVLRQCHGKIADYFEGKDEKLRAIHLTKALSPMAPGALMAVIKDKHADFSFIEALELLAVYKAIDFASTDAFEALQLQGMVLSAMGQSQEARGIFEKAIEHATDELQKLRVVVELAKVMNVLDELAAEAQLLEAYIPVAKSLQDGKTLGQLLYLQGNLHFPRGEHQEARRLHLAARDVASRAKDARTEALALSGLGDSYYAQGRMHSATQIFKECLGVCARYGLRHVESSNRFMLATTRLYLNETHEALADALASANLASKVGNLRAEIVSRLTVGWLYTSLGQVEQALSHYDMGLKVIYAIGAKRFEPFLLEGMAKCHFISGQHDKALQLIQKAWQLVEEQSLFKFIGPWVLGTQALLESSELRRQEAIERGLAIIDSGCLAHNHYRFYVAAAEASILARNARQASQLADQLEAFTVDEPCAWAGHHMGLIRSHVQDLLNPFSACSAQTLAQVESGRQAGLVGASPVLHRVSLLASYVGN